MKNVFKVAFLTSIITAALVYVVLEWKPLRPEASRPPESVSAASGSTSPAALAAAASEDEKNNIDIYQRYSQGVVNITSTTVAMDFFFRQVPESGTGSGAVIDTNGNIITNHHVIADAQRLEVTLWDKSKYNAKVVGDDPNHDLAVIKIDAPKDKLKPIPLGSSKALLVGMKVLAIGNPYGLERTLTTGIISSLGRSIETQNRRVVDDVIQTDAAINPGNSGGPLMNSAGEIIGINTAIYSESGGSVGIGFAIPVDTVKEISSDLLTLGYVPHGYLGVRAIPLNLADYPMIARALRLNVDHGLLVSYVQPGSPAQKAGFRQPTQAVIVGNLQIPADGDVILAINGRDIGGATNLNALIDRFKPGERITVTVVRDGRQLELSAVLAEAR